MHLPNKVVLPFHPIELKLLQCRWHANDTATALTRLDEMGVPPYLVGASVVGVMAQRLVRKVCPSCSTTRTTEPGQDDLALSYGIQSVRVAQLGDTN